MRIDWTNFYILHNNKPTSIQFSAKANTFTEIKPEEYFKHAKESFNSNDELTDIDKTNIISNVKRCIDCKCENILKLFGYDKKIIDKNYPNLKEFFKGEGNANINFISYLTDLNMILIEEVRKLRHIIEHDYKKVTNEEVERAIAIGELFLIVIDSKFHFEKLNSIEIHSYPESELEIYFTVDDESNDVFLYLGEKKYSNKDKEFVQILRIIINGYFYDLPSVLGKNIDKKFVKFNEYYDINAMKLDMFIDEMNRDKQKW